MSRLYLEGQKFGRLLVLDYAYLKPKRGIYYNCLCDCGNIKQVSTNSLKKGETKSCGCYKHEIDTTIKHGGAKIGKLTSEYKTWIGIKTRCYNLNNEKYPIYGGRGIKVCDKWLGEEGFINFLKDMGNKPSSNHSIDRINVNGNYCPENCKWSTRSEQQRNKTNTKFITFKGETLSLPDWCDKLKISKSTLIKRLNKWTIDEAFTKPIKNKI